MSKALKCDVCNTCFDPNNIGSDDSFLYFPDVIVYSKGDYNVGRCTRRYSEIHLCPECSYIFLVAKIAKMTHIIMDEKDGV